MKKTLLNFSISLLLLLIPTFLIILLITFLTTSYNLPYMYGKIIVQIASIVLLFLFAFIFAKKQKNHGIFHGLLLVGLYLLVSLLIIKYESNYLLIASKCLALLFGSIIGVNFSKN